MKSIAKNTDYVENQTLLQEVEEKYKIQIREDIKEFIKLNSGGYPLKDVIEAEDDEYEVRVFLSVNKENTEYYLEKPLKYFLEKTNGKIIPIAIDSGDNYYCVNNQKEYYARITPDLKIIEKIEKSDIPSNLINME